MQTTSNTPAFIHAQQYSNFILTILHDGLLPTVFYRDVSDFGSGTTLNIKTTGTVTLQDVTEDEALTYNPLETNSITLSITDYIGAGWYVTDVMKQDGSQIDVLMSTHAMEAARAIQENFETRYLATAYAAQTNGTPNNVNGFAHRITATGTTETVTVADLISMKIAFDKANVPQAGRVAIVDPIVEATLLNAFQGNYSVDSNPKMQSVLENNFAQEHKFLMNIFGWDIWTSNRLPDVAAGQGDGTNTLTNAGKANIFMSVLDDNHKPLMVAWRQQPRVEGERNKDRQRDEFVQTARWGVGVQRVDTLGVILTDATTVGNGS